MFWVVNWLCLWRLDFLQFDPWPLGRFWGIATLSTSFLLPSPEKPWLISGAGKQPMRGWMWSLAWLHGKPSCHLHAILPSPPSSPRPQAPFVRVHPPDSPASLPNNENFPKGEQAACGRCELFPSDVYFCTGYRNHLFVLLDVGLGDFQDLLTQGESNISSFSSLLPTLAPL